MNWTLVAITAVCALCAAAAVSACYGCQQIEQTKREAMKAGLIQQLPPGGYKPLWTKPE